jgi:hypothetical protein
MLLQKKLQLTEAQKRLSRVFYTQFLIGLKKMRWRFFLLKQTITGSAVFTILNWGCLLKQKHIWKQISKIHCD